MNKLQVFAHEKFGEIRVIDKDGEPWFVATDIAKVLGYANPQKAIRDHCKGVNDSFMPSKGGQQRAKIIPEADLYRLILRSKLKQAEEFQDWVVTGVLPSIRKHGVYMTDSLLDKVAENPSVIYAMAETLLSERSRRIESEEKLRYLTPNTPFGTPSEANGLPREQLVRPYWRSIKTTTITEETIWQRQLFDLQ